MGLNELAGNTIGALQNEFSNLSPSNVGIIAGASGLVIGAGAGAGLVAATRRKKTKKHRKSYSRKHHKRKTRHKKHRKTKHTKRSSSKKIHYTKNNQPYIILASGKARFIKKSSSKRRKKMKGGYY